MLCRFTTIQGVVGGLAGRNRKRKAPSVLVAAAAWCGAGGDDWSCRYHTSTTNTNTATTATSSSSCLTSTAVTSAQNGPRIWSSSSNNNSQEQHRQVVRMISSFGACRASSSLAFSSSTTTTNAPTTTTTKTTTAEPSSSIPESFWKELEEASMWRADESEWDYNRCRQVVTQYDQYLEQLMTQQQRSKENSSSSTVLNATDQQRLLDANTVTTAFKTLLKCKFDSPTDLRVTVRLWERRIGRLGQTPLTDHLSLRLLTANAKAGNLGRCLSLLELRAQKKFRPREREFYFAVTAIQVAASATMATSTLGRRRRAGSSSSPSLSYYEQTRRNIFISNNNDTLENPTRWLDAILMHMKQRGEPLTTSMANHMLRCYIGTGGCTGRAVHHFYRIQRHPVTTLLELEDENDKVDMDTDPQQQQQRPLHWLYVPEKQTHVLLPTQVKLVYKKQPPPYYKVPTQFKKEAFSSSSSSNLNTTPVPLLAAFAFADSLQHGACGHDPIALNVQSYNALIQACVVRGVLTKAMHCMDKLMPANNVTPNTQSYNFLLTGLARVGDVEMAQDYFHKMLHVQKLQPDTFTVQALVNGQLNRGDAPAAITTVQNCFNQHGVLPSYTTHLKILEFCLATGLVYEAKRHMYFVRQLWHWKPGRYHAPALVHRMERTQRNPQLQLPALQQLFAYFGERLDESEFQ